MRLKRKRPSVWEFVSGQIYSENRWGWHHYDELLECANNILPEGAEPFTAQMLWDNFFALSNRAHDPRRSTQSMHWLSIRDGEEVGHDATRSSGKPNFDRLGLSHILVPAGWGNLVLQAINRGGISAVIRKAPPPVSMWFAYAVTPDGREIDLK